MSDPIPSYDVDDVLSSIRKLVADDPDQGGNVGEDQTDQDGKAAAKGALLLTPAFRVDADKGPGFETQRAGLSNLHTALSADGDTPKGDSIVQNLRETWIAPKPDEYYEDESEDGLTSFKSGEKWSPDQADEKPSGSPDSTNAQEEPAATQIETTEEEDPEFQWKHRALGQVVQDMDDVEEDTSQRDSVLSELSSFRTPVEPAADGSEEERITIPRFRHRGWSYDLASAAGWSTERAPEPEVVEGPAVEEAPTEEPAVEEAVVETAEAQVDVTDTQTDATDTPETIDATLATAATALAPELASEITPQVVEKANTGLIDGAMIDEAMLRDIVSDILREEMSGALGERITRNVRKLVRREIHRAMMTQDFD